MYFTDRYEFVKSFTYFCMAITRVLILLSVERRKNLQAPHVCVPPESRRACEDTQLVEAWGFYTWGNLTSRNFEQMLHVASRRPTSHIRAAHESFILSQIATETCNSTRFPFQPINVCVGPHVIRCRTAGTASRSGPCLVPRRSAGCRPRRAPAAPYTP